MFQALKDFFLNNYFIVFSQARQQNDPTEICDSICQRILASTSSMQNKAVRVVVAERSQTIYSWIRWVQTILSKSQKLCSKKGSSNYWGSAEENSLWDLPKMLSKMQSVVGEKKHPHSGILEWSSREIHFFSSSSLYNIQSFGLYSYVQIHLMVCMGSVVYPRTSPFMKCFFPGRNWTFTPPVKLLI